MDQAHSFGSRTKTVPNKPAGSRQTTAFAITQPAVSRGLRLTLHVGRNQDGRVTPKRGSPVPGIRTNELCY